MLASPDLNVERVRLRIKKGGHGVPEQKIRERWDRSLAQLPWFLEQADQAAVFENSGAVPPLVGQKRGYDTFIDFHAPLALREALRLDPQID